jgi:hypothetical protein
MRMVFGVLSLLFVVAIIGFLAKKQLSSVAAPPTPAAAGAPGGPALSGTPKQQVQQFKQAVEVQVQQPRAMPDDTK